MTQAASYIAVPEKFTEWSSGPDDAARAGALASEWDLSPLLARIIARRGPAERGGLDGFLNPVLGGVHSPDLLMGIGAAVDRIAAAIERAEPIWIYGDYDVDGLSSSALLWRTFRFLGVEARIYVPNRLNEGYGMNIPAVDQIAAAGARLIITVDNGIGAVEEIRHAATRGIDVVVTDHHKAHPPLPPAAAIVNPNQPGCGYPCKALSGVGVTFKLAHALLKRRRGGGDDAAREFLKEQLDLVALGTVADVVPLVGENRILVKFGLERLAQTRKVGLRHMMDALGLRRDRLNARSIGFILGPRINAAGRTHDPAAALEILTTDDEARALDLARHLDNFNDGRRRIEDGMMKEALRMVESEGMAGDPVLVLAREDWSMGVLGLVAGRLARQFYKPAICLDLRSPHARGSCRSIPEFDIHAALCACEGLLHEFGGHRQAAGLAIDPERIADFRMAIGAHFLDTLGQAQFYPTLDIDGWVEGGEINYGSVRDLQGLEPFGEGNPEPVFALQGVELAGAPRGLNKNTLKFSIKQQNGSGNGHAGNGRLNVIGFGMANDALPILNEVGSGPIDIAFTPALDTYIGGDSVILQLKALRVRQ